MKPIAAGMIDPKPGQPAASRSSPIHAESGSGARLLVSKRSCASDAEHRLLRDRLAQLSG